MVDMLFVSVLRLSHQPQYVPSHANTEFAFEILRFMRPREGITT